MSVMFQRLAIDMGCRKLPKATHQIVPQQFAKVITTHVIQMVTWGENAVSHPKIRIGCWFAECCTEMPRSTETARKKQYHGPQPYFKPRNCNRQAEEKISLPAHFRRFRVAAQGSVGLRWFTSLEFDKV